MKSSFETRGLRNVQQTLAARNVSAASKGHLSGFFVFGEDAGRIVGAESHLELNVAFCLSAHSDTADLREQVPFGWQDATGKARTHYFDFVVTTRDGELIAYSVKPLALFTGRFAETIRQVAQQAKSSGQYADVRLFTDKDLDAAMLFNAKLLHACRAPIADHDALARQVARNLTGVTTLEQLVVETGLGGDGFRAVVRLIRDRTLRLRRHERISYAAEIYKGAGG